jgi:hypothetical protein
MQKALIEMNLQLDHVLSDITGTTGWRIKPRVVRPLRLRQRPASGLVDRAGRKMLTSNSAGKV